jgi:threonine dehydrogenase-like Zn-dependent dehydrogenase
MMALKAMGVSTVYVVDVMQNRLNKAKELGATEVINGKDEDAVQKASIFRLKQLEPKLHPAKRSRLPKREARSYL